MAVIQLTLISKPGCHLCDDARAVVTAVLADVEAFRLQLSAAGTSSATSSEPILAERPKLSELSILDDAALAERFADDIPVLLIDGEVHSIHRVDAAALRASIMAVSA